MTAADDLRINAMATARAVKAVRLWLALADARSDPPTADDIATLTPALKDQAVRAAGVKVASADTWKVTEAIAAALGGAGARKAIEALPVDARGPEAL